MLQNKLHVFVLLVFPTGFSAITQVYRQTEPEKKN